MTHLIIDEVHERTCEMDMLLVIVRRLLAYGAKFKLILMSATMDVSPLLAYFKSPLFNEHPGRLDIPVIEIKSKQYRVKEVFICQCLREQSWADFWEELRLVSFFA